MTTNSANATFEILRSARVFNSIILMLVSMIGLIANSLIIVSYGVTRKLRSKTNALVVNLAIANSISCVFLPVIAFSLVTQQVDSPRLDTPCIIAIGVVRVCIGCSVLTVTLIAVNRFVLITKNHGTYKQMFRTKLLRCWYTILWLFPIVVVTVPVIFSSDEFGFDRKRHVCGAKIDNKKTNLYGLIFVTLLIPAPLIVSFYCYIRIYTHIRRHNHQLQRKPTTCEQVEAGSSSSPDVTIEYTSRSLPIPVKSPNPVEITHSLFWVLLCFVVFFTPQLIAEIANASATVILHTSVLVTVSCCINPLLYGLSQPLFRAVCQNIVSYRWKEIPEPTLNCLQVQNNDSDITKMSRRERHTTIVKYNDGKTLSVLGQRANMVKGK